MIWGYHEQCVPKDWAKQMHLMKECSYLPDNAFLLSTKKGQGHGRQRLERKTLLV